ncbi:hypothetical protein DPMN_078757 [Dreissena polymorpha]|uniref:Uncharacterized protein n=1 Tax=Dreissena polymorpha TaxID=45954 RepID=A0A9D4BPF9_DREPO|nr:hypothetical protein DPMN_078757 [Dreissena polymorpha]
MKARDAKIQPGDLVIVRNVALKVKQKIADRWEDTPFFGMGLNFQSTTSGG